MPAIAPPATFAPEALAANPRAIPRATGPDRIAGDPGRPAAFAYDPDGVPAEARARLAALPRARRTVYLPRDLDPRSPPPAEELLLCDVDDLERLAAELPLAAAMVASWRSLETPPAEPKLMGIVNATPDSFSDGGLYLDPTRAVERGLELEAQGAEWIDVGGESTRPGAVAVPAAEEARRVLPVLRGLAARLTRARLSIDTTKSSVARAALDEGASLVNDVSAGRSDPEMLPLVAERGCGFVAMHAQGDPRSMQADPRYGDPVAEVARFLRERLAACWKAGIDPTRIVLDPGIGFGKRLAHNLALLRRLPELRSLGRPLLVGVSRKSFIAHLAGTERQEDWVTNARTDRPVERVGGTAAAVACAVLGGAELLRVHDVGTMAEAVRVARAIARPETV